MFRNPLNLTVRGKHNLKTDHIKITRFLIRLLFLLGDDLLISLIGKRRKKGMKSGFPN